MESVIKFLSEGKKHYAIAKRLNDVFYEIVEGRNVGALVHILDVIYEMPLNPEVDEIHLDELQAASDYLERLKE